MHISKDKRSLRKKAEDIHKAARYSEWSNSSRYPWGLGENKQVWGGW